MKTISRLKCQMLIFWLALSLVTNTHAAPSSLESESHEADSDQAPESPVLDDSSEFQEKHESSSEDDKEMDSRGFHGDTFDEGLKRFSPYKRADSEEDSVERRKREAYDPGLMSYMNSIGYDPTTAWGRRKRSGYMESVGYDPSLWGKRDDFSHFYYPQQFLGPPFKRTDSTYNDVYIPYQQFHGFKKRSANSDDFYNSLQDDDLNNKEYSRNKRDVEEQETKDVEKRRPEMDASGFHGDTFSQGFGDFYTLKKRRLGMGARGFHGDTFNQGFGDFSTMRKRRPEMDSSGFYGDTFSNGFGDFYTMKRGAVKRRPEMDSSGFYGDTFSGGFGDFYTMKRNLMKRRPEMDSSGFYGDTFSGGFGDFYTMKKKDQNTENKQSLTQETRKKRQVNEPYQLLKRRPEMTSSGFHGDTFSGGFGDFYTMKRDGVKRRPEMDSSGFYGDTFSGGFGDFYTMKKRLQNLQKLKNEGRLKRSVPNEAENNQYLTTDSDHRTKRSADQQLLQLSLFDDDGLASRNLQKRHLGIDSRGFHGDVFSDGFGDFTTMRKR